MKDVSGHHARSDNMKRHILSSLFVFVLYTLCVYGYGTEDDGTWSEKRGDFGITAGITDPVSHAEGLGYETCATMCMPALGIDLD